MLYTKQETIEMAKRLNLKNRHIESWFKFLKHADFDLIKRDMGVYDASMEQIIAFLDKKYGEIKEDPYFENADEDAIVAEVEELYC